MAIIVPGGLGVRESILTGYLNLAGLPISEAATISISARLWFLIGEIFFFVTAYVLNSINKYSDISNMQIDFNKDVIKEWAYEKTVI